MLKALTKVTDGFKESTKDAERFATACNSIKTGAEQAGKGAEKAAGGLGKFASSIVRIAKYRLIRAALKEIIAGFKEGLQNAYQFSKGIGGDLAAAMDAMSVKSQTMRNQLGAAFGQVLTNIMPVLLQLISVVTKAANAITQFFALLGGKSTYLKAVDSTGQMTKNLSGGAAAAKELRRTLMGFDEINRLDAPDNPSGGGGGGTSGSGNKMFEVAPVNLKIFERLKPAIERVREAFERLSEAWEKLKENFDGSWLNNLVEDLLTLGGDLVLGGLTVLIDTLTVLVELFNALETGDWSGFEKALGHLFEDIAKMIDDLKKNLLLIIIDALIPVAKAFDQAFGTDIAGKLEQTRRNILNLEEPFETSEEKAKQMTDAIREQGIVTKETTADITLSTQEATGSISAMGAGFTDTMYILKNLHMPTFHFDGWNEREINLGPFGSFTVSLPQISFYKNGGFPEDGLFMANHGELVGQFSNGQTAVANNGQIIDGIRQGVYEAMVSANGNNNRDIRVFLDGKEIGAASRRYERQMNRATGVALG